MRGAVAIEANPKLPNDDDGSSAFQIIVLGCGGGPDEGNVSGLLVRSVASQWAKNSILAVDAGVHLAAIIKIFEKHLPGAIRYHAAEQAASPSAAFSQVNASSSASISSTRRPSTAKLFSPIVRASDWTSPGSPAPAIDPDAKLVMTTGPFKNIILPCEEAKANASLLLRNLISTYLITHPHLDHISGFAINTAAFHNTSRPKKVAALPWCIDAIKNHIFNDVIWPNLSDEEGGVGFVSYTRLVEGGNVALGDGKGRGYIEVCEGLEVKCWSVSHGHCMRKHTHPGSQDMGPGLLSRDRLGSRASISAAADYQRGSFGHSEFGSRVSQTPCVTDSATYFIRCAETGKEVLIFGDVEPDSISLLPRNARVWDDAAPKIVSGTLRAIFIECSYDDSQSDETLFGHLTPRHLTKEMCNLAERVSALKYSSGKPEESLSEADPYRKRKRQSDGFDKEARRGREPGRGAIPRTSTSISPSSNVAANGKHPHRGHSSSRGIRGSRSPRPIESAARGNRKSPAPRVLSRARTPLQDRPLAGLKVVIIHVKETLTDSTPAAQIILKELNAHEKNIGLGLEYVIPSVGESIYL